MAVNVDPLILMTELKHSEAVGYLKALQSQLDALDEELEHIASGLKHAEVSLEHAASAPQPPEDLMLHQQWLDHRRQLLKRRSGERATLLVQWDRQRTVVTDVHAELKALGRYKEKIFEHDQAELQAQERKESDEIAGQRHQREAASNS